MSEDVASTAFGQIRKATWATDDSNGREFRDPSDSVPKSLWELVGNELREDVAAWHYSLAMDGGSLYTFLPGRAHKQIFTSAINDVGALLGHIDRLDGRSAAHVARALFEHLVNMRDVLSSATNTADRYLDHRHVTSDRVSRRRWYFQFLDRRTAKQEASRLDKLGRGAQRPLGVALAAYGKKYPLGWASGTLKDRAAQYGLADDYEGYRILSGVIHGSSGALAGIVREVRGTQVHRFGPDLDLAGVAYAEGLANFYQLMVVIADITTRPEAEELRDRSLSLLWRLQEVREALRKIDNKLSPVTAPLGSTAVVALYGSGKRKWYLLDMRDESIVLAHPPSPEPDLTFLAEAVRVHDPAAYGGRPMTFPFADVVVVPQAGAPVVAAESVILPRGHAVYRQLKDPRSI